MRAWTGLMVLGVGGMGFVGAYELERVEVPEDHRAFVLVAKVATFVCSSAFMTIAVFVALRFWMVRARWIAERDGENEERDRGPDQRRPRKGAGGGKRQKAKAGKQLPEPTPGEAGPPNEPAP